MHSCNTEFSETVEIRHRSIFIDISLKEHSIRQKKMMDDIRKVSTLLANCNQIFFSRPLSHQKNAFTLWVTFKCRQMNFDAIIDVSLT